VQRAVVTIAAQVDEPKTGGSREPFRKRRASAAAAVTVAGPLDDEDEQEDDDITGIPAPERLAR
jgi:hypothetical protein